MKAKTYLFSAIFLTALLFIIGCQKNPPAPTPIAPKITVTYPQGIIPYGDSVALSWSVSGSADYVSINGKEFNTSGTFNTGRIFDNPTTYTFLAVSQGITAASTIVKIKVGDWKTSMYGLISYKHWIFGSLSEKSDLTHNLWVVFSKEDTDPAYYEEADYYHPDGVFETRDRYTNALIYSLRWNLSGDTISFVGGGSGVVTQATEDTMTTVVRSSFADSTGEKHLAEIRWIYVRDTTK